MAAAASCWAMYAAAAGPTSCSRAQRREPRLTRARHAGRIAAVEVAQFADIAVEFRRRIEQIQWASMTTVVPRNRPRGRLVYPVWEEPVGWLATGRHSFKAQHLERNPFVSLAYWDQSHEQVYVECRATWVDDDT